MSNLWGSLHTHCAIRTKVPHMCFAGNERARNRFTNNLLSCDYSFNLTLLTFKPENIRVERIPHSFYQSAAIFICNTERIISRLYTRGFRPPVLLSEIPIEVSSNSLTSRILLICSLTVAWLTSNKTSICFCVSQTVSLSGSNWTSILISPSVNKTNEFF